MTRRITHRCDGRISPDGGYCDEDKRIACPAVRYSDGTVENSQQCGEPCAWIMGKGGYGVPPWETRNGVRFNPFVADPEEAARPHEWLDTTWPGYSHLEQCMFCAIPRIPETENTNCSKRPHK